MLSGGFRCSSESHRAGLGVSCAVEELDKKAAKHPRYVVDAATCGIDVHGRVARNGTVISDSQRDTAVDRMKLVNSVFLYSFPASRELEAS